MNEEDFENKNHFTSKDTFTSEVVVNVNIVAHVIFQSLSAHPFIQSQLTQICSLTHSQPTQTNKQPTSSPFHCLVPWQRAAPFPSYAIYVNFRSNHLCIYLCVIHVFGQSENQLVVYNIVSSMAPCSLHVK